MLFVIVVMGFNPRLATESSDSGENRLEKIRELIEGRKYSIHDLSRCQARRQGEYFRLNMPFELGIDCGCRKYFGNGRDKKKFLILEEKPYRFQAALSDTHGAAYDRAMKKVRYWLRQQTGCEATGPSELLSDYVTFSEWEYESKLAQGYSKEDIEEYPTFERLEAMRKWVSLGKPVQA